MFSVPENEIESDILPLYVLLCSKIYTLVYKLFICVAVPLYVALILQVFLCPSDISAGAIVS